jgi:hypothetical protein
VHHLFHVGHAAKHVGILALVCAAIGAALAYPFQQEPVPVFFGVQTYTYKNLLGGTGDSIDAFAGPVILAAIVGIAVGFVIGRIAVAIGLLKEEQLHFEEK